MERISKDAKLVAISIEKYNRVLKSRDRYKKVNKDLHEMLNSAVRLGNDQREAHQVIYKSNENLSNQVKILKENLLRERKELDDIIKNKDNHITNLKLEVSDLRNLHLLDEERLKQYNKEALEFNALCADYREDLWLKDQKIALYCGIGVILALSIIQMLVR